MSESVMCPRCEGKQKTWALVHRANGTIGYEALNCTACAGVGAITIEHQERINKGGRLRENRIARSMTLRAEAKRIGISPTELSAIEQGRDPKEQATP